MKKKLLKVGLFLFALFLAYKFIDFEQLWTSLSVLTWPIFVSLIFISTLDRLAMAYKWHHLGKALGLDIPLWESIKAYYAASFVNYFLPSSLGGDLIRGTWVARVTGKKKEVFASLIMEKAIGLVSIIVLCWAGLIYFSGRWDSPAKAGMANSLLVVSAGAAAAFAISLNKNVHAWIMKLTERFKLNPIHSALEKIYSTYLKFGQAKGRLFFNFMLGVIENIIQFFIAYGAALGLGIHIDVTPFLAMMALVTFVRRLAAYLDSWGISEAIVVAMFNMMGIAPSLGLALSLTRHASIIVASLPGILAVPSITKLTATKETTPR